MEEPSSFQCKVNNCQKSENENILSMHLSFPPVSSKYLNESRLQKHLIQYFVRYKGV